MYCLLPGTGAISNGVIVELLQRGLRASELRLVSPAASTQALHAGVDELQAIQNHRLENYSQAALSTAMQGCDSLLLAPPSEIVDPSELSQLHSAAIAAAQGNGIQRIVFLSRSCARPDSVFRLAPYLLFAESLVRQSGLEWTILRQGFALDILWQQSPLIKQQGIIRSPIAHSHVNFVSYKDLACSAASALLSNSFNAQVLELTGPSAITMQQLAEAFSRVWNQPIRHQTVKACEPPAKASEENVSGSPVTECRELISSLFISAANQEFSRATPHVEQLTGRPPESVLTAIKRLNNAN